MTDCTSGKVCFPNKELATIILDKLKKSKYRREKKVYHCEDCNNYHFTSQG